MNDALELLNRTGWRRYRLVVFACLLGALAIGAYLVARGNGISRIAIPENQATLYTCGMHPQVIQNEPGSCPICGMDLTPMSQDASGAHTGHDHAHGDSAPMVPAASVRVASGVIQKMGLRTAVVEKGELSRTIRAVSHIDFNETTETVINARINGWAEQVYADFEGQRIDRGQPLVGIYSPEFVATQEEYLHLLRQRAAFADPEGAAEIRELLAAARQRLRYWNVSERQIRRLERTGRADRLLILHSPYSGVVVEKKIVKGARVTEGMDLMRVSDLSTVWAFIHIPEPDMPFVEEGMAVRMELPQIPGKEFAGEVSFIFPYMDAKARDLKVRASFDNPELELKPGMYANLYLEKRLEGEHVLVPATAVIRTGKRDLVFVYRGDGVFEPREVKLGVTDDADRVQVLSGLSEQEAVVVSGQFLLDSESRIQEAVKSFARSATESNAQTDPRHGGHSH